MEPAESNKKKQKCAAQADCLPALAIKDGKVENDPSTRARAKGLVPDCPVIVDCEPSPSQGVLLSFDGPEHAKVRMADGDTIQTIHLDDLAVDKEKLGKKTEKPARPLDNRQPGKPWALMTEQHARVAIKDSVRAALFTLNGAWGPAQDQLRVHEEHDGERFSINFPAKAGSLVFVPFTQVLLEEGARRARLSEKQPEKDERTPVLKVSRKEGEEATFWLSPGEGFFWKFLDHQQHQSEDAPNLVYKDVTAQTTAAVSAQMMLRKRPSKKASKVTFDLSFQVLTNESDLPALTVLRAPAPKQRASAQGASGV